MINLQQLIQFLQLLKRAIFILKGRINSINLIVFFLANIIKKYILKRVFFSLFLQILILAIIILTIRVNNDPIILNFFLLACNFIFIRIFFQIRRVIC